MATKTAPVTLPGRDPTTGRPCKAIIHVNRHFIAAGTHLPPYAVKRRGKTLYAFSVIVHGRAVMVDARSRKPLSCGARAWMETYGNVTLVNPLTHTEVEFLRMLKRPEIKL